MPRHTLSADAAEKILREISTEMTELDCKSAKIGRQMMELREKYLADLKALNKKQEQILDKMSALQHTAKTILEICE